MPSLPPVIAIDGPTASGKGTVAVLVAEALGFRYLESGALYRLVALASERVGLSSSAAVALGQLTSTLSITFKDGLVLLQGEDVSTALRAEPIGKRASEVAIHPQVRAALVGLQRSFRQLPGLVADGRDMGSVIFPDASLKVYLTASVLARGQRRYKQLIAKGFSANMADLLRDLEERDARDQTRENAPLLIAAGAKTLDTSDLSVDQAVRQVLAWYQG